MQTVVQAKDIKGSTDYFALNHYTSLCASALLPHAQFLQHCRRMCIQIPRSNNTQPNRLTGCYAVP